MGPWSPLTGLAVTGQAADPGCLGFRQAMEIRQTPSPTQGTENGALCNKYLTRWKPLWHWVIGRCYKSFEVREGEPGESSQKAGELGRCLSLL